MIYTIHHKINNLFRLNNTLVCMINKGLQYIKDNESNMPRNFILEDSTHLSNLYTNPLYMNYMYSLCNLVSKQYKFSLKYKISVGIPGTQSTYNSSKKYRMAHIFGHRRSAFVHTQYIRWLYSPCNVIHRQYIFSLKYSISKGTPGIYLQYN